MPGFHADCVSPGLPGQDGDKDGRHSVVPAVCGLSKQNREGSRLLRSRNAIKDPPELNVLVHKGRSPTALGLSASQEETEPASRTGTSTPDQTPRCPNAYLWVPAQISNRLVAALAFRYPATDSSPCWRSSSAIRVQEHSAYYPHYLPRDSIVVVGINRGTVIGSTTVSAISTVL